MGSKPSSTASLFIALLLAAAPFVSVEGGEPQARRKSPRFAGALREPPDRVVDAQHLRLEVAFDWDRKEVRGKASHRVRSFQDGLEKCALDGVALDVARVTDGKGRELRFEAFSHKVEVYFAERLKRDEVHEFTIEYRCRPERGIYFHQPEPDAPSIPKQLWSQGETEEARYWIPCFDHPADRLSTELLISAPEGMTAISNGRLLGTEDIPGGRGKVHHWKEDKEHTTYLIAVAVGEFAEYRGQWRDVPLIAYVPPQRIADAPRSFELTGDMMEYFSTRTGVPYPWEKYAQICVHEFLFGGMENTTATILTDTTLHDERAALDVTSMDLVSHELAHQWFGNLVTCEDWSDIWLNESFATFFENQYRGHRLGWDEAVYDRHLQAEAYLAEDRDLYRRPLVSRRYRAPDDMFDRHSYPKGARILSMLLYVVGEDSFFRGIQRYLERNAFRSVESSEFRVAMEEATGKSLGWFFDQWVYSGGHPEFHVSYEWDDQLRSVALHVKQQQVLDDATTLFRTPVEIEITTAAGRSLHRVEVSQREEHFTFPCPARPRLVRFDKQDWILKELVFPRSREELIYQLEEDDAAIGRLQAAVELGAFKADSEVRTALLRRALAEPFWGVRLEIVKALKEFVFDDVRVGLIDAYKKEPKAPVRAEILRSLAFFSGADVTALLRTAAEDDASYFAVAEALRGLAKLEGSDAVETLLRACDRASHGDVIRISALESLGLLAEKGKLSSAAAERIVERLLALSGKSHPVSVRGGAFLALARIGRIDRSAKSSQAAYERLVAALDDSYVYARMAAYRALGELGETRAVPLLKARAEKETHRPFRDPKDAVDEAIRRIESQQGEGGVQEEIGRIRRAQEEFERRLDRLEKR